MNLVGATSGSQIEQLSDHLATDICEDHTVDFFHVQAFPVFHLDLVANPFGEPTRQQADQVSAVVEHLQRAGQHLDIQWEIPEVFYDPRSLQVDAGKRACLRAKCVVVDGERVFVSSANFSEAAQERNIEIGLLVNSKRAGDQIVKARYHSCIVAASACRSAAE